jgi:hypothetical protein
LFNLFYIYNGIKIGIFFKKYKNLNMSTTKVKEIPNIKLYCETEEDIKQLLLKKEFIDFIMDSTYNSIRDNKEASSIVLFNIENLSFSIEIEKHNYKKALQNVLKYYEKIESFDACIDIAELIKTL